MIAQEEIVSEKQKIVTPKTKESNDLMFEYLIRSAEESKEYKRTLKVEESFLCSFKHMYFIVLTMIVAAVVGGTYYIEGLAWNKLIEAFALSLCMGFVFSLGFAGIFAGLMGCFFDSKEKRKKLFKDALLKYYNIDLNEGVLRTKDGLAKVLTMLEDLSNNSYTEELLSNKKRQMHTDRGNKISNFAQSLLYDVKDWGVSVNNTMYHLDLAVSSFCSEFFTHQKKEKIKEENKDLEVLFT